VQKYWIDCSGIKKKQVTVNQFAVLLDCFNARSSFAIGQSLKAKTRNITRLAIGTSIKSPNAQLKPAFEKILQKAITVIVIVTSHTIPPRIMGIIINAAFGPIGHDSILSPFNKMSLV
jgi:hypothetical protein